MKRIFAIVIVVVAGCANEPAPPSCQQAFGHYYSIGCSFVDLATGQPVPQGQITADCQSLAAAAPEQCQDELDVWLTCLNDVKQCGAGDCSQEQMTLLRCQ
jgi:hypothetical protein